jgi:hypothetical protein
VNAPAWLAELHRQWYDARGLSLRPPARPFSRDWPELLDAAGLQSAAERSNAEAEARKLHDTQHLKLRTHKYRTYLIEKVAVPIDRERWLIELFGGTPAGDLHRQSLEIVASARSLNHPRLPESWTQVCDLLHATFEAGKNAAPYYWKEPQDLAHMLNVLFKLTAKEWPAATLIRDASSELTGDSKLLEKWQTAFEAALSLLFREETILEALGILGAQSNVHFHGSLALHITQGVEEITDQMGNITLTLETLRRAESATTKALRILTIENAKTTFRQAVAMNTGGDTLLIATSYPNAATRRLLEILPADLPHYHFGDTDASGYAILRSLREIGRRPVQPFLMDWRDAENAKPLSEHDRRILPALLASPLMADCVESLRAMEASGRKGRFEQEAHGAPTQAHWPFWPQST